MHLVQNGEPEILIEQVRLEKLNFETSHPIKYWKVSIDKINELCDLTRQLRASKKTTFDREDQPKYACLPKSGENEINCITWALYMLIKTDVIKDADNETKEISRVPIFAFLIKQLNAEYHELKSSLQSAPICSVM